MAKWQLKDSKGRTLKVVEAEDHAAADIIGLKNFPTKYSRAVNLEEEAARDNAAFVELRESFKRQFLAEGRSEDEAERMADIAAQGRGGRG